MENSLRRTRTELLLLFALYIVILPRVYMDYDMGFWRLWALAIHKNGLSNAYNSGINYFPVNLYCLYIYDLLQGSADNIARNINSLKIFFVAFDFLPVVLLAAFRQKIFSFNIPYLYLLLNIAYVFNSMVWGQSDSIYTNLCFLAIVTGFLYPAWSLLLFVLAINTKPQAIEFLPVLGLIWIFGLKDWKTFFTGMAGAAALQFLLVLPFIANGSLSKLLFIATHPVDVYNKLSICAFNIWYLIAPGNPYLINDKDVFFLFSYKSWGLIMFVVALLWVLLPVYRHLKQLRKEQQIPTASTYQLLFLGTGMVCLYFFYFNAQMHERYANPIIIFFFFYGIVSKNYKLYVLASIPYFLSLDKCFPDYLPITHYKFIFASRVIALWYTAAIIYGSYLYFKPNKKEVSEVNESK